MDKEQVAEKFDVSVKEHGRETALDMPIASMRYLLDMEVEFEKAFGTLMQMKLYTCNDHIVHWPVGAASIILAENEEKAAKLLTIALHDDGLDPDDGDGYTLTEVDLKQAQAIVLCNGDY